MLCLNSRTIPKTFTHVIIWLTRAYVGSEFVAVNTLAKWKKLEPNENNFSQGFSQKVVSTSCFAFNSLPAWGNLLLSADNLCKQFGPKSGLTKCRAWSGSKLFETLMVLKKSNTQRVKYGIITKCEGIIKVILENPKADQNTPFRKIVIFKPPRQNLSLTVLLANDLYL